MNPPSNANTAAVNLLQCVDSVMQHCPWTGQKTVAQLVDYTSSELEEIKEAIAHQQSSNATNINPSDDLESEVGDLLFDAFLLARICERDFKECSLERMFQRVTEKIQRRCPHVFANETCETAEAAAAIWQREKAKEKATCTAETKSNHANSTRRRDDLLRLPDHVLTTKVVTYFGFKDFALASCASQYLQAHWLTANQRKPLPLYVPEDCKTLKEAVNRVHEDDRLTTIVVGKGEHQWITQI